MKKYLTCTIFYLSISGFLHAQENKQGGIYNISIPFKYLDDGFSGQKFLFSDIWVKGKILTANNSVLSNDSILYNYDKIDQRLLITTDFKNVYEIDRREFKALLFYWHDSVYVYKHINGVSNKDLFQVLIGGHSKYSLFKTIHTKIIKGSYGAVSFGTSSDKYLDNTEYCVIFPNQDFRMIHILKRSSIEQVFKLLPESEEVDNFLNRSGKIDYEEEDLVRLIAYLNSSSL